jgi:hypothetical protein
MKSCSSHYAAQTMNLLTPCTVKGARRQVTFDSQNDKYASQLLSKDVSFFTRYYSHNVYSEKSKFKFRS